MKKKSFLIVLAAFIAILAAASLLYPKLSERYAPNGGRETAASSAESTAYAESAPESAEKQAIPVPDFAVFDTDGNEVRLSDFLGKPVVVNLWTTWCDPCKAELPAFERVWRERGEDVVFLMINLTGGGSDSESGVRQFVAAEQYTFPVYFDLNSEAAYVCGAYSIPETLFINADGTLHDLRIGAIDEATLQNGIDQLTGGTK